MKRFPIIGALLLLPALGLLFFVGCTNPPPAGKDKTKGGDKTGDPEKKAAKLTAPTEGKISGFVKFKGEKPEMKQQPGMDKHDDKATCLAGAKVDPKFILEQTWLIGKDGGVENVVVWLGPPEGKEFDVTDKLKEPFKTKQVILDQPFCQYVPHMLGIYADTQELVVKNTAKIAHNVKISGGVKNGDTSDTMKPGETRPPRKFKKDANPIPVACNMHTWMTAKIHTFDHPYFAVTDKDGKFTIENVPVGEELVVTMWHEAKGKIESKKKFDKGENTLELELSK